MDDQIRRLMTNQITFDRFQRPVEISQASPMPLAKVVDSMRTPHVPPKNARHFAAIFLKWVILKMFQQKNAPQARNLCAFSL